MGHFLILYGEGFVSENEAADLFRHGEVPIDFIDRRPDRSLKDGIGFQGRFVISNVIDLGPFSRPFRFGYDQADKLRSAVSQHHGLTYFRLNLQTALPLWRVPIFALSLGRSAFLLV